VRHFHSVATALFSNFPKARQGSRRRESRKGASLEEVSSSRHKIAGAFRWDSWFNTMMASRCPRWAAGLPRGGRRRRESEMRIRRERARLDACVDHRSPKFAQELRAACPKGIDVYFENVGGQVLEAVVPLMNLFGRVPVCGLIAHYNAAGLPPGPDRCAAANVGDAREAADLSRLYRI
jgi:hypothetical protein